MYQHDDIVDTLAAMKWQEDVYMQDCLDYLQFTRLNKVCQEANIFTKVASDNGVMNEGWRESIAIWFYNVVDKLEIDRECAVVAISYLDRFISLQCSREGTCPLKTLSDMKLLLLASATSLFIASKVYERRGKHISINCFVLANKNSFCAEDMESMEAILLSTLSWKMHPPTAFGFIQEILPLMEIHESYISHVLDVSRFLVELCACDYYFVKHRPSELALAALSTAIKSCVPFQYQSPDRFVYLTNVLLKSTKQNFSATIVRIEALYLKSAEANSSDVLPDSSEYRTARTPERRALANRVSQDELSPTAS